LPLVRCFTGSVDGEIPEGGLKEGWQLKFMVDDRCVCVMSVTVVNVVIFKSNLSNSATFGFYTDGRVVDIYQSINQT